MKRTVQDLILSSAVARNQRNALTQAGAGIAAFRRGAMGDSVRPSFSPQEAILGPVSTHLSLPLDNAAIERILPHRYPFLLVDKITEFEEDRRIVGIKNVSLNERYLAHRPGEPPALPPTILTEAVAQVGAILILAKPENREKLIYFLGIEQVRYLKPVHPGDVVVIEATVERLRSRMGQLKGFARVGDTRVVEGTMAFALGPRKDE